MKIMVVSPHPDDETLGAGGTILRLKEEGNEVYWLNMTDVSTEYGWEKEFVEKRKIQIQRVKEFYEFDQLCNLKLPPARLEQIEMGKIIDKVSSYFNTIKPEWVILPDYNDAHSDHRITFESCLSCTKSFRYPFVKRVTTMEIVSETNFGKPYNKFEPTLYVDITNTWEEKIEAAKIYDTEMKEHPFPRSIEAIKALATIRGTEAGTMAAEAFRVIKEIM